MSQNWLHFHNFLDLSGLESSHKFSEKFFKKNVRAFFQFKTVSLRQETSAVNTSSLSLLSAFLVVCEVYCCRKFPISCNTTFHIPNVKLIICLQFVVQIITMIVCFLDVIIKNICYATVCTNWRFKRCTIAIIHVYLLFSVFSAE